VSECSSSKKKRETGRSEHQTAEQNDEKQAALYAVWRKLMEKQRDGIGSWLRETRLVAKIVKMQKQ